MEVSRRCLPAASTHLDDLQRRRGQYPPRAMVERIADMPGGAVGFRAGGKITRDEYHEFLAPVRDVVERGDTINFLFATEPDFSGLDMAALWEDVKAAGTIGLKHRGQWGRFAVVTDKDWLRHAVSAFGWLSPGELRIYEPDELDQAKLWVGGAGG
jgi:hypothetical protein